MKKSIAIAALGLVVGLGLTSQSRAEEERWFSPLGLGIAAPIQIPFMGCDVYGIRLDAIMALNRNVYGVDVGPVGVVSGTFAGLQVGAFGWSCINAYGLQANALANVVEGDGFAAEFGLVNYTFGEEWGLQAAAINRNGSFGGVQLGALINWNDSASAGVQFGLGNGNQSEFSGASVGFVNFAKKMTGCQLGVFNIAEDKAMGCQLGLINAANEMHGVQIGLINVISGAAVPALPIANADF